MELLRNEKSTDNGPISRALDFMAFLLFFTDDLKNGSSFSRLLYSKVILIVFRKKTRDLSFEQKAFFQEIQFVQRNERRGSYEIINIVFEALMIAKFCAFHLYFLEKLVSNCSKLNIFSHF